MAPNNKRSRRNSSSQRRNSRSNESNEWTIVGGKKSNKNNYFAKLPIQIQPDAPTVDVSSTNAANAEPTYAQIVSSIGLPPSSPPNQRPTKKSKREKQHAPVQLAVYDEASADDNVLLKEVIAMSLETARDEDEKRRRKETPGLCESSICTKICFSFYSTLTRQSTFIIRQWHRQDQCTLCMRKTMMTQ